MFKITNNFLTSLDYFGQKVELTFNKQRYAKTLYGGIISLMVYLSCIAFTISIGIQLVFRINPSTTLSTQTLSASPIIDIYKEDLLFAFYVLGGDFKTLNDPSIATITAFQQVTNRTVAGNVVNTKIPFGLTNCTDYRSHFTNNGFDKDFSSNGLNNAFCLSANKSTLIGGNFIGSYYSTIQIFLNKCKNGTSSVTCQGDDVINSKLKQGYFELYYLDWNIDPSDYDSPFKRFFSNYFLLLDPHAWKLSQIFFKQFVVSSDTGLVFESPENKTQYVFDYYREQIDTSSADKGVVQVSIVISQNISTFNRIYMKFQGFFADVGGLVSACIFLGTLLTEYFTQCHMNEYMMNCIFSFKNDENKERSILQIQKDINNNKDLFHDMVSVVSKRSSKKASELIVINNNFINKSHSVEKISLEDKQKEISKQLETKIKDFNDSMSSNFSLSIKNKVYKLFNDFGCKIKRRSISFYDSALTKLERYLDFLKIITLLKEFRQLKKILFNQSQYMLFKNHNRQIITINEDDDDEEKMKKEVKYFDLYEAYLNGQESAKDDKIYSRLLDNFDQNLCYIFDRINEQHA
jgi:hypothetical protein